MSDPLDQDGGSSPDNSSHSTKFKRNYRACLNCRVRKVKCDLGSVDNPREGKCARCLRERKDCVFVESRRGGAATTSHKRKKRTASVSVSPGPENSSRSPERNQIPRHSPGPEVKFGPIPQEIHPVAPKVEKEPSPPLSDEAKPESSHFSTMEGALIFLANAAGTIAKADERDNIDARQKHEQLEARTRSRPLSGLGSVLRPDSAGAATSSSDAGSISRPESIHRASAGPAAPSSVPMYIRPANQKRMSMPAAENGEVVRPRGHTSLASVDFIGGPNSIVSEKEATTLINLFFSTMHPFFPHIPQFLHLPQVLSGYPILLCAILTISARYHPFEDNAGTGGVPRNIEVHDRLWLYVQRLISQTVWAEASTRSIGTVFAFLLFTEWNPRAIHWRWSDYANKAEENDLMQATSNTSDEPTGLGAMRRSYRMAWMLIGSAVRLAQDCGFMEISAKTFSATHIAEINSVMNISRRSMLAHSLSEVDLGEEDITEEDMEQGEDDDSKVLSMSEEDLKKISNEHVLRFTRSQKAQIELLQIMSLGHEALYGYKAQLGSLSQRQNLSVLSIMSPLINNWRRKYASFLVPSNNRAIKTTSNLKAHLENPNSKVTKELQHCLQNESFIFEFNYAKLYIYSLALSPSPKVLQEFKHKKINLKLDEISKSAKYIEQAFSAANEMLLVAHRVHKLKLLRFMPVRWLTRIVRAVAFIVKCYLTITAHKSSTASENASNSTSFEDFDSTILSLSLISIDEIIQSIQRAGITLRDCSPDELHLCTRYSNVLMYLCSEMKTKSKQLAQDDIDEYKPVKKPKPNTPQFQNNMPAPQFVPQFEKYEEPTQRLPYESYYQRTPMANDMTSPLHNLVGDSEVMEWFINDRNIGLDFVGPWTEMIEQQLNSDVQFNYNNT